MMKDNELISPDSQVAASEEGISMQPQSTLQVAIKAVPPLAWQPLTPQLFSLLRQDQVRFSKPINASCMTTGTHALHHASCRGNS